jgi:hypothetical protein
LFSLLFLVVAIVGSGVLLALRGLRLFRNVKSLKRTANEAISSVTATAAQAETHAAALSDHMERLTLASERLQASLARLAVLRAAADELRRSVTRVRGVVPRK